MLDLLLGLSLLQYGDPCNAAVGSPPANCTQWRDFGRSETDPIHGYYDPASVRRRGQEIDFTMRFIYDGEQTSQEQGRAIRYRSTQEFYRVDCRTSALTLRLIQAFATDGEAVFQSYTPEGVSVETAGPRSFARQLAATLC